MASTLQGPFDVTPEDLTRLTIEEAVTVFHELLLAEARRSAKPITAVSVPKAINVGDGGVDAEVECVSGISPPVGLIMDGLTRYQIKTGGFSVRGLDDIKELMLAPKYRSLRSSFKTEHLQPRVRTCLENGGTFVVVLFGSDLVGTTDDHGVKQVKQFLSNIDPKLASVSIRIIRANQLCAAIRALCPGIALSLNGLGGMHGHPLQDLKFLHLSCDLEVNAYQSTNALANSAAAIRTAAETPDGFQHIRVVGEAGAGKTHLVYEALKDSPYVLYCVDPEQLDGSSVFVQLIQLSETATIVLVADECDASTAHLLQARLKNRAVSCLLVS